MNPASTIIASALLIALQSSADESKPPLAFDFGPGAAAPGFVQVSTTNNYSSDAGYGFEPGASNLTAAQRGSHPLHGDFISSKAPFYFSVAVPEGNYRVTVHLAGGGEGSVATVKA